MHVCMQLEGEIDSDTQSGERARERERDMIALAPRP